MLTIYLPVMLKAVGAVLLVLFDRSYKRSIVHGGRKFTLIKNIGKIIDIGTIIVSFVLSAILLMHMDSLIEPFYNSSVFEKLAFFSFLSFCLLPFLVSLWPTFRSYVMIKLGLEPQRYLHRVTVYWILYEIAYFIGYQQVFVGVRSDVPIHARNGIFIDGAPIIDDLLYTLCGAVPAILAVGIGITRNKKETLARLGLGRKLTCKGFFLCNCLLVASLLYSSVLVFLFGDEHHGLDDSVSVLDSLVLYFVIGVCTAIGEELLYRGALQPRLGIWVTSIVFVVGHLQKAWFGLLITFLNSLLMGWIAHRYNLWLSMWFHMFRNTLVLILYPLLFYPLLLRVWNLWGG
ncbi:CPBP family intramembrane glutamic endopeptidase [Pasteuria penetrans]|uniref:CPBP family intramembrane glutamic endopeptidase n=1 Tax=Pasteuria penetrans TaxID=86005 RepID=UPI000F9FFD26|nr:CPBP family intramembrane glutamic endopeptidase [Pasteuria penetrans]